MTMTKLPTDVAFDLLVVEQLHDIVPCEWRDEPCDRTGHWLLSCPGCPRADTFCTPHRVELDRWVADAIAPVAVTCADCDTALSVPLPWVAV